MKNNLRTRTAAVVSTLAVSGVLLACGGGGGDLPGTGGGGGGDLTVNYPGTPQLELESTSIDAGDFDRVTIRLYDVNPNGVVLKLRYPSVIRYSRQSAVLNPDEDNEQFVDPYTEETSGTNRYLVFFLETSDPEEREDLTIQLDLKASDSDPDAFVEVDLDNNDPRIRDTEEFNVSDPQFSALEREGLEVREDPATQPTATPTPAK